jgi:hypothetical protein
MNPVAGFRLGELKWKEASEGEVAAMLSQTRDRYRGDEARARVSKRGFGPYAKKRNEVAPNLTTIRDGWYWDTATVAAGAAFPQPLLFFQVAQSASKALNSTNLTGNGGQVPTGDILLARSIRVIISNATVPADFANIVGNCSVQFLVRNTPIYQWTPEWLPAGCGVVTLAAYQLGTAPTGTATVTSTTNGMPVQTASYEFTKPYLMESLLPFAIRFNADVAFNMAAATGVNPLGVGTTIRIYIEGQRQAVVTS